MVDTPNKGFELPAFNSNVNSWDVNVNTNSSEIDTALGGSALLNATGLSGNVTLVVAEYRPLSILVSGTPIGALTYVIPSGVGGQWVFANNTSGGQTIGIKSNAGGATIIVSATYNTLVSCDGTSSGMRLSLSTPPAAGGSTTQVQFNSGGVLSGSSSLVWDGTTLGATGINVAGNAILGVTSGSTLTINGTAISAPNNINIDSNTVFIDTTNNLVGIGTATLSSKLTVAGVIESTTGGIKFPDGSTQSTAAGSGGASGATGYIQFNNAGAFFGQPNFTFTSGSGLLAVPAITTTGNISIGGSLSVGTLSISGTVTASAFSGNGASITGLSTGNISGLGSMALQSAGSVNISGGSISGIAFGALSVTSLTASGAVSAGSLSTSGAFSAASLTASGAVTAGVGSRTGDSTTYIQTAGGIPVLQMGAGSVFLQGGNMQFGATGTVRMAMSDSAFTISSTTSFNPSGTWTASSDERLKYDIAPRSGMEALVNILRLRPVDYNWHNTPAGRPDRDRGFIAQQYATVYPFDVTQGEDGYWGIGIGRAFHADMAAALTHIWNELCLLQAKVMQ